MSESLRITHIDDGRILVETSCAEVHYLIDRLCDDLGDERLSARLEPLESPAAAGWPRDRLRDAFVALVEALEANGDRWRNTDAWRLLVRESPAVLREKFQRVLAELERYPVESKFAVTQA